LHPDLQAGKRRLFTLQFIAQFRAVDGRDGLCLLHDVARLHEKVHRARRRREQRRADGRNDRPLRRDIPDEGAAGHFSDTHTLKRHGRFRRNPAAHDEDHDEQQHERTCARRDVLYASSRELRRRIDRPIRRRGIANASHLGAVVGRHGGNHRLLSLWRRPQSPDARGAWIT
jgi:hypothetical protein